MSAIDTWPAPLARLRAGSRRRRAAFAVTREGVAVVAITLACVACALRLWRADLSVPLRYTPVDDTKFYLMLVKGIIDHGWYLTNSSLGAPFGQQLYDYPQGGDNLSLLMIRGLALLSSNPALVANLFFLLTFALVSLSSYFVLRRLGVSVAVAAVVSVLFSLLPYHFFRGESQLLLSAYYSVPLSALLFLELLDGRAMFAGRRSLATIGLCVVIGSANAYYATFALALIVAATLVAAVLRRWRSARDGALIVVLVLATLAVNLAPSLLYQAVHGPDPAVQRSAAADQRSPYALDLRPTSLIVPVPDDRIAPLRRIGSGYDRAVAPAYCETCYASLGVVGTVGLGWLGVCVLAALVGATGWFGSRRLFRHAGAGVAIAIAVGTVGGLGERVRVGDHPRRASLEPDLRGDRVPVAARGRAAAGRGRAAAAGTPHGGGLGGPAARGGARCSASFEQTTAQDVPAYAANARQWHSDGVFVGRSRLACRAARACSSSRTCRSRRGIRTRRWAARSPPTRPSTSRCGATCTPRRCGGATERSRGGRRTGRRSSPAGRCLPAAAVTAAGFDGLWVDPAGFEPAMATRVRAALRSLLGAAPLISPDRDLWFFDLRPYRARLERADSPAQLAALRARTLHPVGPASAACVPGGARREPPGPGIARRRLDRTVVSSLSAAAVSPRGRSLGALCAPAIAAVSLLGLVASSLTVVLIAAERPSFLAPVTSPGFFPAWMVGPLRGLWPGLTANPSRLAWLVSGLMALMFVLYIAAFLTAPRLRARWTIAAVLAIHAIFLLAPPLSYTDVFNYVNYGRMGVVHHLNPYVTLPTSGPHGDPSFALSNWHHLRSPYGPLFTLVSYALVPLGVKASFWALKLLVCGASLATLGLVWRCARLLRRSPVAAVAFVAFNPIVLIWGLGADHNDALMMLFVVLAVYLALRERPGPSWGAARERASHRDLHQGLRRRLAARVSRRRRGAAAVPGRRAARRCRAHAR